MDKRKALDDLVKATAKMLRPGKEKTNADKKQAKEVGAR